jgi:catalase
MIPPESVWDCGKVIGLRTAALTALSADTLGRSHQKRASLRQGSEPVMCSNMKGGTVPGHQWRMKMSFRKTLGAFGAATALILAGSAAAALAADPTPADLVDALNSVFGKHAGMRAAHTKGFCMTGTFTPSGDAAKLSKAPHFAKQVPIIARFSLGGGDPNAADNAQDNVSGLAVKFELGNGATTDLVTISAPVFFAKTPEQFVELLKTLASGDKDKLNAFFAAHPETTRQNAWLMSHPVSASYATVGYWGVHAFTFTNAAGKQTLIKYRLDPEAGNVGLTPDEAKAKGPDFYATEFKDRIAKGPVVFDLKAIMGKQGDPTNDPTLRWDDEDNRPTTDLGKISLEAIAPHETCDAGMFLPGNLVDGIAGPSDDPIFAVRSPAYIVSFTRRKTP